MVRRTIKTLPSAERPRERLVVKGPAALSAAELLAILLGTGNGRTGESALDLAGKILRLGESGGDQGLRFLLRASLEELQAIGGIGQAKAIQIKAALELGRRMSASVADRRTVSSPADAAALLMEKMRYLEQEHFRVVLLNTKNHVIAVEPITMGGLNASVIQPREVFREAVRRGAACLIMAHNHPSGDPAPSPEDIRVTETAVEAGRLLGIEVLDHLIIGDNRYVSFREEGILRGSGP